MPRTAAGPEPAAAVLLTWYDRSRRHLPWRTEPGVAADPYAVWLSEVMLQQTTVGTVIPYFQKFLARWPTVAALAAASLEEVRTAWAGLGYYTRAANLHRCARLIVESHGGRFPSTESALRTLPGIGGYTAAAVAAIAFDQPATVVDGNVERVIARIFAIEAPLPAAKPRLKALAETITPTHRPGDYAQAIMDLGATVCTPVKPRCPTCPWRPACRAQALGIAETLPRRAPKPDRPTRRGAAFWAINPEGAVLLRRRHERGLLGGMTELPGTAWAENGPFPTVRTLAEAAPLPLDWRLLPGQVRHSFTHFHLELQVLAGQAGPGWEHAEGFWVGVDRLGDHALPSVMRKVVGHVLKHR